MPPHSSSTSIRRCASSFAVRPQHDAPAGAVNLKALFKRFVTADASICGSALTAHVGSPGSIANCSAAGLGVEAARDGDVVEEGRDRDPLAPLLIGGNPDVGQRAVDEVAQTHQAPAQHRPGAAVDGDGAPLQRL